MVMVIIHTAYLTCLATNDALHAYDVIGIYMIHHRAGRISYFAEPIILWLAKTVMGEVGAITGEACALAKRQTPLVRKNIVLSNQ